MIHAIAALLHHVADATGPGRPYAPVSGHGHLCAATPEARRLGLVESPGEVSASDEFWLRLTPKGQTVAAESLLVMSLITKEGETL